MKHDNGTIVRDICIATGAVTAACIASLATTAKYLFHFCIDTQWKRSVFHQSLIAPERIEKLQQGEAQEAGEWFAQAKQPVTITSDDGLRLHGWLFDPDCTSPKPHLYAICMHGYTGVPEETAKWAHRYARMGFTVLVPSQRAQDLSEGRYVGMGWLERNDLLNWIDLIVSSDTDARILLYGGSMGAATVMMTTGDPRLPRNVVSAIVDSGYTSARMVFIDSLRHSSRLPKPLAAVCVDAAGLFCKHYAGYDFSEATCLQSLRHTVIPVLFIHGEQDDIVSSRFLKINYEACSSIDREKLMVPDARHMEASVADPELYWNTVNAFIKRAFEL